MPTYGYECLSCDNEFETFQSIKDDALTTCGECGGALRKKIYPVGIAFKGSGFYVNDYAAKPAGEAGAAPAEAKPTDAKAAETTPKPEAAKTETVKTDTAKTETAKAETPAPKREAAPAAA